MKLFVIVMGAGAGIGGKRPRDVFAQGGYSRSVVCQKKRPKKKKKASWEGLNKVVGRNHGRRAAPQTGFSHQCRRA
jgi:hypothetical protein